jgi:uncharacterized linocin/CFP29 family protein
MFWRRPQRKNNINKKNKTTGITTDIQTITVNPESTSTFNSITVEYNYDYLINSDNYLNGGSWNWSHGYPATEYIYYRKGE